MNATLSPLRMLLVTLAGWINRHQQDVIEYLVEENRLLTEQLKGRRLRFTDDQRRRLAAKGHRLGRRILRQVASIVTPDTILRWHRQLIARKWTFTPKRQGRPGVMTEEARQAGTRWLVECYDRWEFPRGEEGVDLFFDTCTTESEVDPIVTRFADDPWNRVTGIYDVTQPLDGQRGGLSLDAWQARNGPPA